MSNFSYVSCRRAFCKATCSGNYDTCSSLGTCKQFEKFCFYLKLIQSVQDTHDK